MSSKELPVCRLCKIEPTIFELPTGSKSCWCDTGDCQIPNAGEFTEKEWRQLMPDSSELQGLKADQAYMLSELRKLLQRMKGRSNEQT